jgi:deazaflavin-dependent oxidoreductase (nitroreductase family)
MAEPIYSTRLTGAKSGQRRTNPVMYLREGDRVFIFASKQGAPTNPDWYHNLVAHPDVTVEIGDQTYQAIAKPVAGEERDQIYSRWAEKYPQFHEIVFHVWLSNHEKAALDLESGFYKFA